MYRQDSAWYHLAFSANFFQTAHTGGLLFTDPLRLAAWFYPQNSELLHGVGMVGFDSDFLSPLVNLGWMALALLAAWCVGRPFGLAPLTLIAAAILFASNMMQTQAGNAPNDMPALFFLLAMIAVLVNAGAARARSAAAGSSSRTFAGVTPGPLFAAALAAGLAVGTKVTLLPAIGVLTLSLVMLVPREVRWRSLGIWSAGILLAGGFWYVRNLVHAGNPFPWVGLGILPEPDQTQIYPRPPHSIAGYLGSPGVWVDWFAPGFKTMLGLLWPLLLAAAAAGLALALRQGEDRLLRALGLAGVVSAAAYVLVPIGAPGTEGEPYGFSSNLRYLAPALLIGLLAAVLTAARRRVPLAWIAAALTLPFAAAALASDAWSRGEIRGALLLAVLLVGAPVTLVRIARSGVSRAALGAAAALALGVALLGYSEQRTYAEQRYLATLIPPLDNPGFRSAEEWEPVQEWARRQRGERIGLVGPAAAFGQYIFYGEDLSNRVRYIGEPGPHGAMRPIDNCQQWLMTVNAGGYDYVVITPPLSVGPTALALEEAWTRGDPAVEEVLRSEPASIYRVRGRLDPYRCATLPQSNPFPWSGQGAPSDGLGTSSGLGAPGGGLGLPGLEPLR
jgi:hypothetical protein